MKTIEILSNGRQVQFTTKSVTIAGKEYPYSHISELRHSEAKRVYGFKCDGEVLMLPYEEKDTQVLKVIFSQVQQMHRKPTPPKAKPVEAKPVEAKPAEAPAAPEVPEAPVEEPAKAGEVPVEEPVAEVPVEEPGVTEEPVAEAPVEEPVVEEPAEVPVEEPAVEEPGVTEEPVTEEPIEEPVSEVPAAEPVAAEEPVAEAPALSAKEKKRLEKEQRKADKEAAKREKLAKKAAAKTGGNADVYAESTSAQIDQLEKTARFKKGIIIFIVILAVFALLGIAYYFLIGPASDPQIGPNTTDQTQYNDIDDMINDLEN